LQAIALALEIETFSGNPERFGSRADLAAGLLQRVLYHLALDLGQGWEEFRLERDGKLAFILAGAVEDGERVKDLVADQIGQQRGIGFGEQHHASNLVLQLPHVARPAIQKKPVHCLVRYDNASLLKFPSSPFYERVHKTWNLVAALSQWLN